jgi:ubiquinone/menaquinone biosynthesis C-methylase UbiE
MGTERIEASTANLYDDLWADFREEDFSKYKKRLRKIVTEDLYKDKVCLDAGCGQGAISSIISEKAKKLYSVDIGTQALEETKKRLNNKERVVLEKTSLLNLPFRDNSFDFIISNGVIHHTEDQRRALQELERVLKPGGEILLGLYGKKGLLKHFIEGGSKVLRNIPYKSLKTFFEKLGLNPLIRYYLLDYIYVPVRKRYSTEDLRKMSVNLRNFKELSDYPKGKINKIIYGTNYLYLIAKKQ